MEEILMYDDIIFENIKHFDEHGNEYWKARELQIALRYTQWRNFKLVVNKAKKACENSGYNVFECFVELNKTSKMPHGGVKKITDYQLSRYACYLIIQNGDSNKDIIALGQTYFAVQTRKQELSELDYMSLSEDEKRLYQRSLTKKGNYSLNQIAKKSGVKNFDKFHNEGYKGLYNGETANDIAIRKKLRYREDILDNMVEDELIANLFRINQAKQKLLKDNIHGEENAKKMHYLVGKEVRKTIERLGGTMPEDLPTPDKSIKEIEKKRAFFLDK